MMSLLFFFIGGAADPGKRVGIYVERASWLHPHMSLQPGHRPQGRSSRTSAKTQQGKTHTHTPVNVRIILSHCLSSTKCGLTNKPTAGPSIQQNPGQPPAAEERNRRSGHRCHRRHLRRFQQRPSGQIRGENPLIM